MAAVSVKVKWWLPDSPVVSKFQKFCKGCWIWNGFCTNFENSMKVWQIYEVLKSLDQNYLLVNIVCPQKILLVKYGKMAKKEVKLYSIW